MVSPELAGTVGVESRHGQGARNRAASLHKTSVITSYYLVITSDTGRVYGDCDLCAAEAEEVRMFPVTRAIPSQHHPSVGAVDGVTPVS
jgi:hypothetical protein